MFYGLVQLTIKFKIMKKIIITLAFAFIAAFSYGQTTKIIVNGDTAVKRVYTVIDTVYRKDLKEERASLIRAKKETIKSIDALKELNEMRDARLVEINALLQKTD